METVAGKSEFEWQIHRLLEWRAASSPDWHFLHYNGHDYTHREINERANRLATGLIEKEVTPGQRVAVMMNNSPQYIDVWFAIAKATAVEVPLNTAYKGQILIHMLNNSGATLMIIDQEFVDELEAVLSECPQLKTVIVNDKDAQEQSSQISTNQFALKDLYKGNSKNLNLPCQPNTLACIMFTSGTTGPSKGVMLNHHFEISFAVIYNRIVSLKKNDISLNFLPFFHIAGKFMLLGALLTGSRMILQERFSIENFWNDICAHDVTVTVGVGGICHMLFAAESRPSDAKNPLRMIYAVPNPHDVQEQFKKRFNVQLTEGYGSTEANIVIYSRPNEKTPKGSCGRVAPEYDVKIVDPDGNECPPGISGEFVIRPKFPNTLMSGYYGIPEKSMEVFRDLWFHSGDRGMKDSKGYFYFLDRMKDAIRRRGENISSFEVERIINMHTDVAESAAIAVPAKVGEDEVKVIIVLNEGIELSYLSLLKYCVKTMPYFMVPRFIEFKKTLPRTPTQKVRKIELRKQGITPETWDCHQVGLRVTRDGLKDIC